jgi:hypothetical protein
MARMSVTVTTNIDLREKVRQAIERKLPVMERAMQLARGQIVTNAANGIGFEGESLEDYSDDYKKRREDRGYKSEVNMTVTGQMLRDVQAEARIDGDNIIGRIFVLDGSSVSPFSKSGQAAVSSDKVRWTNVEGRKWFGLSDIAVNEIKQLVRSS